MPEHPVACFVCQHFSMIDFMPPGLLFMCDVDGGEILEELERRTDCPMLKSSWRIQ